MRNVIYLDVLLLLNLFVNYFLFLSAGFLLHQKPKRWRLIAGAAIGSLSSLLILFDGISDWIITLIKLPLAALLVWIAFGASRKGLYLKLVLTFLGVSFVFGGGFIAVNLLIMALALYTMRISNYRYFFQFEFYIILPFSFTYKKQSRYSSMLY